MKVELIAKTEYGEQVIETAGRVSHKSVPGNKEKFIKKLIKLGHTSVLEHASATFYIAQISRSCSHQLVRHRLASYTQESQRYVEPVLDNFVAPSSVLEDEEIKKQYAMAMSANANYYKSLLDQGIPKEDARFVLPNATMTSLVMTANLREWRYIISIRAEKHAQWEIRMLALAVLEQLYEVFPSVFEDLYIKFLGGENE